MSAPPSTWEDPRKSEKLTEMWIAGFPVAKIAEAIGVTKNAAVGRAHRLGLPPRPSPIRNYDGSSLQARNAAAKRALAAQRQAVKAIVAKVPVAPEPARAIQPPTRSCMWTSGSRGAYVCCTAQTVPGSLWCATHRKRAVQGVAA